jgi:hypothetical protein
MRPALVFISLLSLLLTGCTASSTKNKPSIYAAGDKATIGSLVYSLTDAETAQQLGDDSASARTAQNRFYLVELSVTNSGTEEQPIPTMSLVDEAGESFNELADGTNVPNWLGVARKVGVAQTEQGYVLFDVPAKHYRLRLNDPLDDSEVAIDMPLNFVHEQTNNPLQIPPDAAPETTILKR